jgi:hypothetical protein
MCSARVLTLLGALQLLALLMAAHQAGNMLLDELPASLLMLLQFGVLANVSLVVVLMGDA